MRFFIVMTGLLIILAILNQELPIKQLTIIDLPWSFIFFAFWGLVWDIFDSYIKWGGQ